MFSNLQEISLGGVRYKTEYFKHDTDIAKNISGSFVMLRSYAFKNNVLYDTDLYFVEKELFSYYIKKKEEKDVSGNENLTSGLLFPLPNVSDTSLTIDIRQFSSDLNPQYFEENKDDIINSPLIYNIYLKNAAGNFIERDISCGVLRIYKPAASKTQNVILHLYTYINNLKVHIMCRDLSWFEKSENEKNYVHAETEIKSNHNLYSEYIDVPVIDLDILFGGDYYYIENLNAGDIATFDISTKEGKDLYERWKNHIYGQYISLAAFEMPFSIEKIDLNNTETGVTTNINGSPYEAILSNDIVICKTDNNDDIIEKATYVKHYIPDLMHTSRKAQLTHALSVQLIPYDNSYKYEFKGIESDNIEIVYGFGSSKMLVLSDTYEPATTQLFEESKIRLKSHIGFDENGQISLINEFEYPNKENNFKFPTFASAYEYWNGVDLTEYTELVDDEDEEGWWDSDYGESMQCGAIFEIFTDKFIRTRIYKESYGFPSIVSDDKKRHPDIDDFSFSLGGLFTSWTQWPGVMFCRCTFVDRYIGKKLYGSICTITKEQFKHMVCMDDKNTEAETSGSSIIETEEEEWRKTNNLYEENVMDKSRFNFLNNIRVNVIEPTKAPTETADAYGNNISSNATKVIYRPIFYKVHDVNGVRLRSGLTQNVGVNLMDWMTKVETFKMSINGLLLTEYARTDNYVIFNIETDKVTNNTDTSVYGGEYHILNGDGEYITSGSWVAS